MRKYTTSKRKLVLSLILLFLAVIVAVGGSTAIYTSQVFQRSVVRNRDAEAIRFSSDKLYRVASDNLTQKKYYYPMTQGQKTMSFTVCNYDQSKKTVVNQHEINYDIKFEIKNGTDSFNYMINNNTSVKNNEEKILSNRALTGGRQSKDTYTISFSDKDYNKVEVTVKVTPKDTSLTKGTVLYATLIPIEYATTQGIDVQWNYTDGNVYKPDQVDAYNVAVTISGGEDDVIIKWENDKLDIDPFFMKKMTESGGKFVKDGTTSKLTIHMNSEDETSAYQLQFYNHGTELHNWSEWTDLPIIISKQGDS